VSCFAELHAQNDPIRGAGVDRDQVYDLDALSWPDSTHEGHGARVGGRRAGKNGTPSTFMRITTLHDALDEALAECGLPADLTWYQATRHTFASHWVMFGGSLEKSRTSSATARRR
jgi:hypothetical protein